MNKKTAIIGGSVLLLIVVAYILYTDQINDFFKAQTDRLLGEGSEEKEETVETTPPPPPEEQGEGLQPKIYDPNVDVALIRAISLEQRRLLADEDIVDYLRDFNNIGLPNNLLNGLTHRQSVQNLLDQNGFEVQPTDDFVDHFNRIQSLTISQNVGSSLNPTRSQLERFNDESIGVELFGEYIIEQAKKGVWGAFNPDACGFFESRKECDRERNNAIVKTLNSYVSDMKILGRNAIKEAERFEEVLREQAIQNLVQTGWRIKGY